MSCCTCCGSLESVPPYFVELLKLHLCYLTKDEVRKLFKVSIKTVDRWNGNTSPDRDFPYPRDIEGFIRWSFLELLIWGEKTARLPSPMLAIPAILQRLASA